MLDILDKKFMDWVGKNTKTFLLVAFLAGNVYQYVEGKNSEARYSSAIESLNDKIRTLNEKALEYEKDRTLRMEFLLNNLPKNREQKNEATTDSK